MGCSHICFQSAFALLPQWCVCAWRLHFTSILNTINLQTIRSRASALSELREEKEPFHTTSLVNAPVESVFIMRGSRIGGLATNAYSGNGNGNGPSTVMRVPVNVPAMLHARGPDVCRFPLKS